MAFERPEDVVDFWFNHISAYKETLGLDYVAGYNQKLIPSYPAVTISPGKMTKEVHASHTWQYNWNIMFYVMHAKATGDHNKRSREEAEFVTNLVRFIEQDKELVDENGHKRVIWSYCHEETPGVIQPYAEKGVLVLSTRIDWGAISQGRF